MAAQNPLTSTLLESAIAAIETDTGIPRGVWMSTKQTHTAYANARRMLVAKLSAYCPEDIAALTGWNLQSVRNMRSVGVKITGSSTVTELPDEKRAAVRWIIEYTMLKHGVSADDVRSGFSAKSELARWEIVGRLQAQLGLNRPTTKSAVRRFGIVVIDDDLTQGYCLMLGGREFSDRRANGVVLNRALAAGEHCHELMRAVRGNGAEMCVTGTPLGEAA